jgi:hypothetical protein
MRVAEVVVVDLEAEDGAPAENHSLAGQKLSSPLVGPIPSRAH